MGTLRGVLFDVGFAARLMPLEREALRMIHASQQYRLPFARRATLREKMRDGVGKIAYQEGRSVSEVQEDMLTSSEDGRRNLTLVVHESVDELVQSELEKENVQLRARIRELEKGYR